MLVAITGGSGFIGRALVQKHIDKGDQVRVLTRNPRKLPNRVEGVVGDLSDPHSDLEKFVEGVDLIYHCAGELTDETQMLKLHIGGTRRLVDAARDQVKRWVQLSSVGAYGVCRNGTVTEASSENPSGIYEQTKAAADTIVRESSIPFAILRPSNVFGSTMPNQSLFQLIEMVRKGMFFNIGRPGAIANYVHVDDVVEALTQLGSNDRAAGNVYIISQNIETDAMIQAFADGLGVERHLYRVPEWPLRLAVSVFGGLLRFPLTHSRMDALTCRCLYDSTKLQRELVFEFAAPLEAQCRSLASPK